MKFKKYLLASLLALALLFTPACEEPDPEDVCRVINQVTAVAYNEVVAKNPELEEPLKVLAVTSVKVIRDRETLDAVETKKLLYSALSNFSSLEEDDKRIIVDMFAIVIPMLEIPREGILGDKQKLYVICFFEGILQAVEIKEELKTDEEVETKLSQLLEG